MFNKNWFIKHQKSLLWLCNAPVIRIWFRWILRINGKRSSIGKRKIAKIFPNGIFWVQNKKKRIVGFEFRSHDKFAKRIYYAFKPLWLTSWWLCHLWDILVANPLIKLGELFQLPLPKLNLGFDAFPSEPYYPAAGSVSPMDGYCGRAAVNETWATIVAGAGNASGQSVNGNINTGATTTSNRFEFVYGEISCFDTSPIDDTATILTTVISFYGNAKANGLGAQVMHVVAATPASTSSIANGDYNQFGSTSFASITYADFSTAGYNDLSLNASGLANVSKTGVSKFGTISDWHLNANFTGVWASGASSTLTYAAADTAGTSQDPKLTGTFSMPGGTFSRMQMI